MSLTLAPLIVFGVGFVAGTVAHGSLPAFLTAGLLTAALVVALDWRGRYRAVRSHERAN